jgi:CubicO group peptidase (beta-lactamase class C family)
MAYNGKHPAQLAVELDTVLPDIAAKTRLPAFSVDIDVAGGRVSRAYRDGARAVSGEERPTFASGCLMDIFLAIVCLDLHHRRGLDLDTPFEKIVPELAGTHPAAEPITVRHLLTRTSGIQDPRSIEEMRMFVPWEALGPRVAAARRLFSPGEVFNYGGIDRIILAVVLERFTGARLGKLTREIAVDPANIRIRDIQWGPTEPDGFRPIRTFDGASLLDIFVNLAREGASAANPFDEGVRGDLRAESLLLSRSMSAQPWPHAAMAFTSGLFRYSEGLIGFNGWEQNQSCGVRYDPGGQVSFIVAMEGPPIVRDMVVAEIAERLGYASVQSGGKPCTIGGLNGLAPKEVLGVYAGWAEGYEADVTLDANILDCTLNYKGDRFRRVRARLEDEAWLVVDTIAEASALEFFRDRRTGRIGLASGFLPYAMAEA